MHTKPKVMTPATGDVVTINEVKAQSSVTWPDDDTLLTGYLKGAVDHLEGPDGRLGRFLLTQIWTTTFSSFPTGCMRLPFVDVQSVVIKYQDENDAEQTLSSDLYSLTEDERGSVIVFYRGFARPQLFDMPYAITVEMTVGYGTADEVPFAIKVAIQMIVDRWYEHRDGMQSSGSEIPNGVSDLIETYRVFRV